MRYPVRIDLGNNEFLLHYSLTDAVFSSTTKRTYDQSVKNVLSRKDQKQIDNNYLFDLLATIVQWWISVGIYKVQQGLAQGYRERDAPCEYQIYYHRKFLSRMHAK